MARRAGPPRRRRLTPSDVTSATEVRLLRETSYTRANFCSE